METYYVDKFTNIAIFKFWKLKTFEVVTFEL